MKDVRGGAGPGVARGRVLVDPPLSGARNMAVDHALADGLPADSGVLRFYRWEIPTISFGRNQRARGAYRADAIREAGVGLVRRPTGGRAVLHHLELTYAVVLPLRAYGGLRQTYRLVNEGLVEGLRALGVPARVSEGGTFALPPEAGACFAAPAEGEVIVEGRKLVGSAQARVEGSLLQHGSLLLAGDQARVRRFEEAQGTDSENGPGADGTGSPTPAVEPFTTLDQVLLPLPEWGQLVQALARGVTGVLGGEWVPSEVTPSEAEVAERLLDRYQSSDWIWRR